MKLSLTQKGLILVSVPLVFQLLFVTALFCLQNQADADAKQQLNQLLVLAIVPDLILTITLSLVFARVVTDRVRLVTDNCRRLANEHALLPEMKGADELAKLDKSLHALASTISDGNKRESFIIGTITDVIFVIDSTGNFTAVNAAAKSAFGYEPEQLIDSKYVALIAEESKEFTLRQVKSLMEGGKSKPFETRMRRKDGSLIDVVWASQWFEKQQSLLCIAHDITGTKSLSRLRQEVMQMASVDLRTPLATISNVLSILDDGRVGELPEQGHELVKIAQRNAGRVLSLVNDLLEVEKIRVGAIKLELDYTELADVFEEALHAVSAWAKEHKVRIEYIPTTLTIYADEARLVQVLINLLANAVKFSPAGKRVLLNANETYDYIEVTVQNEGPGMPENQHELIFERFQQVHLVDGVIHGTAGLGLAICKAIVERHGGTILVEGSTGSGNTFAFRIPKDREKIHVLQFPASEET